MHSVISAHAKSFALMFEKISNRRLRMIFRGIQLDASLIGVGRFLATMYFLGISLRSPESRHVVDSDKTGPGKVNVGRQLHQRLRSLILAFKRKHVLKVYCVTN